MTPHPRDDPADQRPVLAIAEGAIKVDDVEPPRPLHHEPLRQCDGVIVVRGNGSGRTLRKAHGTAEPDVDGWEEVHGSSDGPEAWPALTGAGPGTVAGRATRPGGWRRGPNAGAR